MEQRNWTNRSITLLISLYQKVSDRSVVARLTEISLSGILTETAKKQSDRYKLFAVEHHQGDQATKGHYITDVFHPGLQGWLRYDDGNVHVVTSSQVINSTAEKLTPYLRFYRRGD